jgi:hypothetical protein
MSEVADRYRRLSGAFAAKVAAVPADRWDAASPCAGWTTGDLVQHVIDTQGLFLGFIGLELDDPEQAAAEFDGFLGRTTFEASVDKFLSVDQVIHGWDLARAAGLDERIDPEDIARVRSIAATYGEDVMRNPQVFGPEVEAPAGADDQTKLLAYLGRNP